jgi:hypothetical protein
MTTQPLQPDENLFTCTMKCAMCLKTLGSQKHIPHTPFSGEPVRWSTVKANYTPCAEHPNYGFMVEWSPED